MTWNRSPFVLLVLITAAPAFAQKHRPISRGGQSGGVHAGQTHPGQGPHLGAMTPEQQMEHEFWQQQLMLNEMMRPQRPYRRSPETSTRQGMAPNGEHLDGSAGQPRSESGQSLAPSNKGTTASRSNHRHDGAAPGPTSPEQPRTQSSTKQETHHTTESRTSTKARELEKEKHRYRTNSSTHGSERISDNLMASHLKNVHAILHRADADYQGHRIKAMHHVTVAIRQLGSTSVLMTGYEYGGGNLPQGESDRLLDDAMVHLRRIEGSLGTGPNLRVHHGQARASVAEAVRELEIARRIR